MGDEQIERVNPGVSPPDILMNLKARIKEFEDILPKINEQKKMLEKDYNYYNDKLNELNEILPKIQEKKNKLEQNIQKVLNDMHIIDEIKEY